MTDIQMENNVAGLVVAGISVVSSGMQQIFCRTMQQKHNLSSHELLSNTAPAQVPVLAQLSLLPTAPPCLPLHHCCDVEPSWHIWTPLVQAPLEQAVHLLQQVCQD